MNTKISRETVFDKLRIERMPHLNADEIKNIFSEMQEVYNENTLSEQMIAKIVLEFIKYEFRGAPNDYLAHVVKQGHWPSCMILVPVQAMIFVETADGKMMALHQEMLDHQ